MSGVSSRGIYSLRARESVILVGGGWQSKISSPHSSPATFAGCGMQTMQFPAIPSPAPSKTGRVYTFKDKDFKVSSVSV